MPVVRCTCTNEWYTINCTPSFPVGCMTGATFQGVWCMEALLSDVQGVIQIPPQHKSVPMSTMMTRTISNSIVTRRICKPPIATVRTNGHSEHAKQNLPVDDDVNDKCHRCIMYRATIWIVLIYPPHQPLALAAMLNLQSRICMWIAMQKTSVIAAANLSKGHWSCGD